MDVVGLALSAIAFVDSAIESGTTLARIFRDCGDAGKQMCNAIQRLEAQKYTLTLWKRSWEAKARQQQQQQQLQQQGTTIDDAYRHLWGFEGHMIILKCLGQLNLKFGEAFRVVRSIDPDSFDTMMSDTSRASHLDILDCQPESRGGPNQSGGSSSTTGRPPGASGGRDPDRKKKSWYRRLSPSDPQNIWRRKMPTGVESISTEALPTAPTTPEERAELEHKTLQQKLSPGTKFRWSVSLKEQIRSIINDVDDWLELLQNMATQCEAERNMNKGQVANNPSKIRAAAKALYTALHNIPSGHDLDFKLEKERADSGYFEQLVGPLEYLDQSNRSFKFPLVSRDQDGDGPLLFLAEAVYPSAIAEQIPPLDKEVPLEDIFDTLKHKDPNDQNGARALLFRSQHTTIVIHGITGTATSSPTVRETFLRLSFAELLQGEAGVNPIVASWKRSQLACIIAISVLHLYETGWISEQLETNDFHFFGSADSQYHEQNRIAPYVSALASKSNPGATPFDCLKRNQVPSNLLGTRDERLATLFHRLGIILFELGRGVQHSDIFTDASSNESDVLDEIEKIPFGRSYRDLVKACLTGSLYTASEINIDSQFDRVVVEKCAALHIPCPSD
jgi:hypothetical protein